ncbi:hypothetical protein B0H14DRAFT_3167122 [Mycena olivaceomarginata]|nr:hypothetical protein B0H14DRAFT_3167122 [Mycena olivaceomarginata]
MGSEHSRPAKRARMGDSSGLIQDSSSSVTELLTLPQRPDERIPPVSTPKPKQRPKSQQPPPIMPNATVPCQYRTGKTLGSGMYAIVEAIHIKTGKYYACKVINKKLMEGREPMMRRAAAVAYWRMRLTSAHVHRAVLLQLVFEIHDKSLHSRPYMQWSHSPSQFSSNMNLTARCPPRSHSASKPHFESIAAMLSTTPPAQPRYDAQQALPFFVAHAAFLDPAGVAAIFSRVTTLTVLRARTYAHHNWDVRHHSRAQRPCVHSPSHMPLSSPPARDEPSSAQPHSPSRRRPTIILPPPACYSAAWWLFLVGGAAFFCLRTTTVDASPLRLPGLHSTHEHLPRPTALPARHSTSSASKSPRLSSRTRDVPPRRNYLQSPPRWSVTCAIRRDYQRRRLSQGTVYSTTTLRATGHATTNSLRAESDVPAQLRPLPHARYSAPNGVPRRHARDCRPLRRLRRVPGLRDRLDQCACPHRSTPVPAALFSVHPRHVPCPAPHGHGCSSSPDAAFSRFLYRDHLPSPVPHRTVRVVGRIPNMTPTSPAPAAAAPPRTPRSSPPRASDHLSAVPNPPLKTRPRHAPRTRRARHARRLPIRLTVFSAAPLSAQRQMLSRSASMTRTTTLRSSARCSCSPSLTPPSSCLRARLPTICGVDSRPPLDSLPVRTSVQSLAPPARAACAADVPHRLRCTHPIPSEHHADPRSFLPSHRPAPAPPVCGIKTAVSPARTATVLSDVVRAKSARAHGDDAQPPLEQQLRCEREIGIKTSLCSLSERAAPPAALRER